MEVQISKLPSNSAGTLKLSVDGRLDAATSAEFENNIKPMLEGPIDHVVLDLSRVPFISSAGIRALMYVNKTMSDRNGKVLLTNMQPQIAKVLDIIRMLPGIQVFANEQEMDNYLAHIQRQEIEKRRDQK